MKLRYFCLMMSVVLCMLLTGCTGKAQQFTLKEFESEVLVSDAERQVRGNFCLTEDRDMTFEITSPDELEGIIITLVDGTMSLQCGEMKLPYNELILQDDDFSDLFGCITLLSASSHGFVSQGEIDVITLTQEEKDYKIYVKEGLIQKISSEKEGRNYSFFYS